MECKGEEQEFRFADPEIEERAQRLLTPEARLKLQRWLGDVHNHALLQSDSPNEDSNADGEGTEDGDDLDELDAVADEIDATPAPHTHNIMQVHSFSMESP